MVPTLKLKTMAMSWRDILINSVKIRDFCNEKYGKPPTFFMGLTGQKLPPAKFCPFIAIVGGVKKEGLDEEEYPYFLGVSWVILQKNVMVDGKIVPWTENVTGEVIEFLGAYEADDLGQLIYDELQNVLGDNWPISKIDYEVDWAPTWYPQWPGHMIATTTIMPTMGENIEY